VKSVVLVMTVLLLAPETFASLSGYIDGGIATSIATADRAIRNTIDVTYYVRDPSEYAPSPQINGRMEVVDVTTSSVVRTFSWGKVGRSVVVYVNGPTAAYGHCYETSTNATYHDCIGCLTGDQTMSGGPWSGPTVCAPGSAPKPTCPGDPSCPPSGTTCTAETPPEECQLSPIVINMGGGGYQLSDAHDPVDFDLTADGWPERITWTARNTPMAFLALDRNGSGTIDDGAELFGNHTPTSSGGAANGFDALADYDANGDRHIDAKDPIWDALLLWTDVNHNGLSEAVELQAVATSGIADLALDYHTSGRRDTAGNMYKYQARLHHGRRADVFYDIYFARVP
jgi:hypothetical protein